MFLLFESDIPFGLPTHFMNTSIKSKYEIIIKENIEANGDKSILSGMVVPAFFAVPIDDPESPAFEETTTKNNQTSPSNGSSESMAQAADQQFNTSDIQGEQPEEIQTDPMNQNIQEPEQQQSVEDSAFEQEITPLKKLYLMQKLYRLNEIMLDQNRYCNELTQILKYGHNLSYQTLMRLAQIVIMNLQNDISNNPSPENDLVDKNAQNMNNYNQIDSDADALAQKIQNDEDKRDNKK